MKKIAILALVMFPMMAFGSRYSQYPPERAERMDALMDQIDELKAEVAALRAPCEEGLRKITEVHDDVTGIPPEYKELEEETFNCLKGIEEQERPLNEKIDQLMSEWSEVATLD